MERYGLLNGINKANTDVIFTNNINNVKILNFLRYCEENWIVTGQNIDMIYYVMKSLSTSKGVIVYKRDMLDANLSYNGVKANIFTFSIVRKSK